jgi:hypothetical protein
LFATSFVQFRFTFRLAGDPGDPLRASREKGIIRLVDSRRALLEPLPTDMALDFTPSRESTDMLLDNRLFYRICLARQFLGGCDLRHLRVTPLKRTAWQLRREDLEFSETRQTSPRNFRDILILLSWRRGSSIQYRQLWGLRIPAAVGNKVNDSIRLEST